MQTVVAQSAFRRAISRQMRAKSISQRELARRVNLHFVTVNRILHGHADPSLEMWERMAAAVGLSVERISFRAAKAS